MKLTDKNIKEVLSNAIGVDAIPIYEYLKNRKNISDFKIAEKTNMTVQQVRNLLYRLHEKRLVTYIRKKDREKGWYISYFTFNKKAVKDACKKLKAQKLENYKQRLSIEQNTDLFYICPSFCVRLDMDNSYTFEFHCPECGKLLRQQNNEKTISHLKEQIKKLRSAC